MAFLVLTFCLFSMPTRGLAHASEQGFVLLLPTGAYSAAGVGVVALTVLALFAIRADRMRDAFEPLRFTGPDGAGVRIWTSLAGLVAVEACVVIGFTGPHGPLENLMPLVFWTVFWVGMVSLSGLLGNLWRWIEPWSGLHALLGAPRPRLRLPEALGVWPATALLVGFAGFTLADVAPDAPARLAMIVSVYWAFTFAGLLACGPEWLDRAEMVTVLFRLCARLAPLRLRPDGGFGVPGWRLIDEPRLRGEGAFALVFLAVGSFDGLNETFWWLAVNGINPLEFPGRSAVVWQTLAGLVLSVIGLAAVFMICVGLGRRIAGGRLPARGIAAPMALTVLPIALAYHVAHYLPSFLVGMQYVALALTDPLGQGADLLGLGEFRVTTGFFNHLSTVRLIWLTQAGAVVAGHVLAVLLAHRVALDQFGQGRSAVMATLPMSLFMIAYTFLGLWLLAAPKGA